MKNAIFTALALLAVFALASCGGGGGGSSVPPGPSVSGNGFAPADGTGDSLGYFPSDAGNTWFFNATNDDPTAPAPISFKKTYVNGTKSVLGVVAGVLTHQDSTTPNTSVDDYYYLSLGGLTYLGNNDIADTITPQIVPYVQMLFPVETGIVSSVTGTRLPFGFDPYGNPITLDLTQTINNVGIEAVNVPAGNFTNAMKQVTKITGVAHDVALGVSISISGSGSAWFAPGVGLVKEASSATVDTTTINQSEDLRGYIVNGVHHGIGLPFTIDDTLTPTGSTGLQAVRPSIAFTGASYALVYPKAVYSTTIPNYQGTWNVQILNPDGTRKSLGSITSPVLITDNPGNNAVASDGTNFLIAIEQDNNFAQTGLHPSIVATLFAADGSTTPSFSTVAPPGSNSPVLAFDGTNYLLVYSQSNSPGGLGQLFGVFISAITGQINSVPFPITPAAGYQMNPAIAFDGTNYLVVWDQAAYSTQLQGVFATRVSPNGTVLDSQPIPIALQTTCCSTFNPSVGFDGTNYLIAYNDHRPQNDNLHTVISAARMSKNGVLLDGSDTVPGIVVTSAPDVVNYAVTVAFTGGDYWLAWGSSPAIGVYNGIYGARISVAGTVMSPGNAGFRMLSSGTNDLPIISGDATGGLLASMSSSLISGVNINSAGP